MPAAEPTLVAVTDDRGGLPLLEVFKRDGGDTYAALVREGDAGAELDHAVVADVDAVMVIEHPGQDPDWLAADLEMVARLKSSFHAP